MTASLLRGSCLANMVSKRIAVGSCCPLDLILKMREKVISTCGDMPLFSASSNEYVRYANNSPLDLFFPPLHMHGKSS